MPWSWYIYMWVAHVCVCVCVCAHARSRQCSFLHSRLSLVLADTPWPAAQGLTRRKCKYSPNVHHLPLPHSPTLIHTIQVWCQQVNSLTPQPHTLANLTILSLHATHTDGRILYPRNVQLWQKKKQVQSSPPLTMVTEMAALKLRNTQCGGSTLWLPWILMDGWPKRLTT